MSRAPDKHESLKTLVDRGVPVSTILDVGVLTGTPELLQAYPNTFHFLFEPVVEFTPSIETLYKDTPHQLVNVAVSNASGEVTLGLTSIIAGVGISHSMMIDAPGSSGYIERSVPMTTLDDWVAANNPPGPYLLKIDIDGFELRVIEGAANTLKQTSVVIVETPILALTDRVKALEVAGFVLFDLIEPVYYDKALWQCDAVMISSVLKAQLFEDLNNGYDGAKWEIWRR